MQGPEVPINRLTAVPDVGIETGALNSGAVNTMARTGAGHALDMTAKSGAGILGATLNILPEIGVLGVMYWGFRKMYQGVMGG